MMNKFLIASALLLATLTAVYAETDPKAMPIIQDIQQGRDNRNQITTLRVSGNATIGGTIAVTGNTTLSGTLDVDSVTVDAGAGVDNQAAGALLIGAATATSVEIADASVATDIQGTLSVDEAAVFDSTVSITGAVTAAGGITTPATAPASGVLAGVPVTIRFDPTTAGGTTTNSYTVPTGYDLVVLNAVGWKTDAVAAAGDTWDLKNNDGTAANIFDQEDIGTATLADKAMAQFDNLDDAEAEIESGNTLEFIATETADDDGAEGIIYVHGLLKVAD